MSKRENIKNILDSIKIEVDNIEDFEKDVDSILQMFDEIKKVDVEGIDASLNRKKITLDDLREDEPFDWKFREEMRGKYFVVPRKNS